MKAVVLAAGEGTRLNKGWTIVPKPLLEVGKRTIIEHVIASLREAGITDILVIIGFMGEHIRERLRNGVENGVSIEYVYNPRYREDFVSSLLLVKDQLAGAETGKVPGREGAGMEIRLPEPFLVCMADLFFRSAVVKSLLGKAALDNNYVLVDRKLSSIRRIEEKVKVNTNGELILQSSLVLPSYNAVDCGIYLLQPWVLEAIEQCVEQGKKSLPLVISELALQGKFYAHDIGVEEIIDVDREKDVEYVSRLLLG